MDVILEQFASLYHGKCQFYVANPHTETYTYVHSPIDSKVVYISFIFINNLNQLCTSILISLQRLLFRRMAFIMIWHSPNVFHSNEEIQAATYVLTWVGLDCLGIASIVNGMWSKPYWYTYIQKLSFIVCSNAKKNIPFSSEKKREIRSERLLN